MSEQEIVAVEPELSTEETLVLALAIIERQHALLVKHGIDPDEELENENGPSLIENTGLGGAEMKFGDSMVGRLVSE